MAAERANRPSSGQPQTPGRVYLVGAGPGAGGLMSGRARELVAQADVILHDRLIPADALDGARADAELVYVGKDGSAATPSVPQAQTEELMVERARAGRVVVRLKGGDPFVFGRGGEEAMRLAAEGIAFEVVPGVSAGVAAGAYAGIPLTQRGIASAVAFVTAHEDPGKDEVALDWEALASFPGTLVFYMGVRALPSIAGALIRAGRSPRQPAAVIERASLPSQRTVRGPLAEIAEMAQRAALKPPSITIVGDVVGLAESLAWFERLPHPLAGLGVTVTRARAQASTLAARLESLGARVIEAPSIEIEQLEGPPLDPSPYDLICVTSPNGVRGLFSRLRAGGRDSRSLAGRLVAAVGPGTAAALEEHGVGADIIPTRAVAEGLAEALSEHLRRGERPPVRRALVARGRQAREVLPQALRQSGIEVDLLDLYDTAAAPLSPQTVKAARSADYVTFTSASSVRFFFDALEAAGAELDASARLVSIGPLTSEAMRERNLEPHAEAQRHDIDGLVETLLEDAAARGHGPAGSGARPATPGGEG